MNASTVVIEPTDSAIKIVVGYVLENEPVILYASNIPTSNLIRNGNIVDIKSLANLFKSVSHIEDKQARVRFDIKNAVLILPPIGLEIYEDKKTTSVISNTYRINKIDLDNVVNMIRKGRIKAGNSFVDIIPTKFYLSNGATEKSPIGLSSSFLSMKAIIYTLPTKLLLGYKNALESSGIKVSRCVIAPYAIAHLLSNKKTTPNAYIFMDVGSSYTSLSLISKTCVYNSSYFTMGGDDLTKAIAEAFNLDLKEAEKIKRRYGFDTRVLSFNPIIASSVDASGKENCYTVSDLNRVIHDYLDNYFYMFDTCLNKMLASYPEDKRNFPIIVGGAASRLSGFIELFKNNYPERNITPAPLDVIGTRNERYLNCVGGLVASNKYLGTIEKSNANRVNSKEQANNKVNNSKQGEKYGRQ